MSDYANFDIMFILNRVDNIYDYLDGNEIHNLTYLSLLLSIFEGHPAGSWGYSFVYHNSQPFSNDVQTELEKLKSNDYVWETDENQYRINPACKAVVSKLQDFEKYQTRIKSLSACADATTSMTLPEIVSSIKFDPILLEYRDKNYSSHRGVLGDGVSSELLYESFSEMKTLLGNNSRDLWLVSLLWIKYLSKLSDSEVC